VRDEAFVFDETQRGRDRPLFPESRLRRDKPQILPFLICKYAAATVTGSFCHAGRGFFIQQPMPETSCCCYLGMKTQRASGRRVTTHLATGRPLYFYSLLVAVYIFSVGGVLALYKGDHTP